VIQKMNHGGFEYIGRESEVKVKLF